MSKTTRLLALMQVLRAHRRPVTAQHLAQRLAVSVRTVYRDIDALAGLGASIDGSAGIGYQLRSGFFLPPLMFTDEEIDALVLGARWVQGQGDASLGQAADAALAKIAGASAKDLRDKIAEVGLWAPFPKRAAHAAPWLGVLREAIRDEHRVVIDYLDAQRAATQRAIWPIALGYFEGARVVAAWCELREDFRHFRVERIAELRSPGTRYPTSRRQLVRAWRQRQRADAATPRDGA